MLLSDKYLNWFIVTLISINLPLLIIQLIGGGFCFFLPKPFPHFSQALHRRLNKYCIRRTDRSKMEANKNNQQPNLYELSFRVSRKTVKIFVEFGVGKSTCHSTKRTQRPEKKKKKTVNTIVTCNLHFFSFCFFFMSFSVKLYALLVFLLFWYSSDGRLRIANILRTKWFIVTSYNVKRLSSVLIRCSFWSLCTIWDFQIFFNFSSSTIPVDRGFLD